MTHSEFSMFLREQGHKVIETDTCCWYDYRPFVFLSVPNHRPLIPTRDQLARVLIGGPAIALRFPTVPQDGSRKAGILVCRERGYDFGSLHPKARNQTRRGLENCVVDRIYFDQLADLGHALNVDTFRRQGKDPRSLTPATWRQFCETARRFPDFEAWGAWVRDKLAAFCVTALVEDCLNIHTQSSATEFLNFYPNNALTFAVTKQKIASPGVNMVCYGVKTLTRPTLDEYKLRMGFEALEFSERVMFNPLVQPLLSLGGNKIVHWLAKRRPQGSWARFSLMLEQCGA